MWGALRLLVVALAATAIGTLGASVSDGDTCNPDKLTVYKMVLHTYWTREKFPKHYPDWRPPAQWSKVYGLSHDASYVLFRLGRRVPPAVREFAESGRADALGSAPGTMDVFGAAGVTQGAGRTEAEFYVDGNHSRVSAMVRMVPSPDWFVGVDSFDLCVDGNWLDTITIEVDPLDAGTDNGFTFTAPNWPTAPQGVAYRITSRYPAHPAGSFFYPHLRRLPPIATFQFIKLREYEVSEVFHHASDERRYDVLQLDKMAVNSIDLLDGNRALSVAEQVEREEQPLVSSPPRLYRGGGGYRTTPDNTYYSLWNGTSQLAGAASTTPEPRSANALPAPAGVAAGAADTGAMLHSLARRYRARRRKQHAPRAAAPDLRRKRKRAKLLECRVSAWSAWSECAGGCGVGESARTRRVLRRARRGGAACPPLTQTRWCTPLNCTEPLSNQLT